MTLHASDRQRLAVIVTGPGGVIAIALATLQDALRPGHQRVRRESCRRCSME